MPATWTKNAVKFELKLSNKNWTQNQAKARWVWSGKQNKNDIKCGRCKQKLNADMKPFDEVKKHKWKLFYQYVLVAFKVNWCGGCEAGLGGIMHKNGTKEFKLPKKCCHSKHRYLHQRLLSIVSWFSKSGHLFLARSKINHICSSLGPPGSMYIG